MAAVSNRAYPASLRFTQIPLRGTLDTLVTLSNMHTKKKYKFSGPSPDTANIDLVIEPNKEPVNVELKEGQRKTIQKDFEKLLREQVSGCAFYHVLQNSNRGTLPALLNKYKAAYSNIVNLNDAIPKWYILFIFVKEKRECFWKAFDNITKIFQEEFDQNVFSKESTSPITT